MKQKFPVTPDLREAVCDPIEEIFTGTGRWTVKSIRIFEFQGQTWSVHYSRGATENQDDYDMFEYEPEVELTLVRKQPVTVEQWVEVDE